MRTQISQAWTNVSALSSKTDGFNKSLTNVYIAIFSTNALPKKTGDAINLRLDEISQFRAALVKKLDDSQASDPASKIITNWTQPFIEKRSKVVSTYQQALSVLYKSVHSE